LLKLPSTSPDHFTHASQRALATKGRWHFDRNVVWSPDDAKQVFRDTGELFKVELRHPWGPAYQDLYKERARHLPKDNSDNGEL
jgi:hypothetical protein